MSGRVCRRGRVVDAGQVDEVVALGVVELQSTGQGVQDAVGGPTRLPRSSRV